jgi:protein gp37
MSDKTKIPWADSTWNPWRGCSPVGPGCDNCYARHWGTRFGVGWDKDADRVQGTKRNWFLPAHWNNKSWVCGQCGAFHIVNDWCRNCRTHGDPWHRRRVFSLSLGDWLDLQVPVEWLARMLDMVNVCKNLTWILCTKRPQNWNNRLSATCGLLKWDVGRRELVLPWLAGNPPKNVWVLASVENQETADERIPHLLSIPAAVHGLSIEPILGPVDVEPWFVESEKCKYMLPKSSEIPSLDWLVVGAERGSGARPCNPDWIRSIVRQGKEAEVPVFVKSLGNGQDESSEWPDDLHVQEFPHTSNQQNKL